MKKWGDGGNPADQGGTKQHSDSLDSALYNEVRSSVDGAFTPPLAVGLLDKGVLSVGQRPNFLEPDLTG
jgi:hypothetical protein